MDGHNRKGCFKRIGYPDWWPGKGTKREKTKPKAACVESEASPLQRLTNEEYQQFLNFFTEKEKGDSPFVANMASTVPAAHPTSNFYEKGNWIIDIGDGF